jgi:hypothetical protein
MTATARPQTEPSHVEVWTQHGAGACRNLHCFSKTMYFAPPSFPQLKDMRACKIIPPLRAYGLASALHIHTTSLSVAQKGSCNTVLQVVAGLFLQWQRHDNPPLQRLLNIRGVRYSNLHHVSAQQQEMIDRATAPSANLFRTELQFLELCRYDERTVSNCTPCHTQSYQIKANSPMFTIYSQLLNGPMYFGDGYDSVETIVVGMNRNVSKAMSAPDSHRMHGHLKKLAPAHTSPRPCLQGLSSCTPNRSRSRSAPHFTSSYVCFVTCCLYRPESTT